MDIRSPLAKAVEFAGRSEAKLRRPIGFSQVAINEAKTSGRVSAEMAPAVDRAALDRIAKSIEPGEIERDQSDEAKEVPARNLPRGRAPEAER